MGVRPAMRTMGSRRGSSSGSSGSMGEEEEGEEGEGEVIVHNSMIRRIAAGEGLPGKIILGH